MQVKDFYPGETHRGWEGNIFILISPFLKKKYPFCFSAFVAIFEQAFTTLQENGNAYSEPMATISIETLSQLQIFQLKCAFEWNYFK